jgi:hypothetical protein
MEDEARPCQSDGPVSEIGIIDIFEDFSPLGWLSEPERARVFDMLREEAV